MGSPRSRVMEEYQEVSAHDVECKDHIVAEREHVFVTNDAVMMSKSNATCIIGNSLDCQLTMWSTSPNVEPSSLKEHPERNGETRDILQRYFMG